MIGAALSSRLTSMLFPLVVNVDAIRSVEAGGLLVRSFSASFSSRFSRILFLIQPKGPFFSSAVPVGPLSLLDWRWAPTSVASELTGTVSPVKLFRGRDELPTELELAPALLSAPRPFLGLRVVPID